MTTTEQNRAIQQTIKVEKQRLLAFIRKRVPSLSDAEDVMQEVFYELVEMYRLTKPIDQTVSWLFTVARNKISDFYRKKHPEVLDDARIGNDSDDEQLSLFDVLSDSTMHDPLMQETILEAISEALEELPAHQRFVFEMHELEGKSFREISDITGIKEGALISEKRKAVLVLRERLRYRYDDLFGS